MFYVDMEIVMTTGYNMKINYDWYVPGTGHI